MEMMPGSSDAQSAHTYPQVALVLRGLARGAPPPLPFVAVASVATAVLLIGWRAAFAALSPKVQL